MAAQPGKSSCTEEEKLQKWWEEARLPTATTRLRVRIPITNTARPSSLNILYCKCRKTQYKLFKKLKKVDLLYALFDVTDQSESFIRSKRCKIYFCLIPSLKCVRNRVPKQQMLIRCCTNYIIIVVLYIYSTRILRIILYYIAIEGSGASISLISNNAQPITLLFWKRQSKKRGGNIQGASPILRLSL